MTTIEKRVLAESGDTDALTLQHLAKDGNNYVRRAALESLKRIDFRQKLPDDWRQLNEQDCIDKLNSNITDCKILEILKHSRSFRIRQAVACHENTPDSIIALLANDEDWDVRQAVSDRHLPQEWRNLDEDERIQRLKTENAPCYILKILSCSENWVIRQHVANNAGANRELLKKLAKDKDDDVSTSARERLLNLCLPEDWRQLGDTERIRRLKSQNIVTGEVLAALATSINWKIRQAVARHEGTPPSLIKKLARDTDSDVRQAVIDRCLPSEWRYLDDNQRSTKLSKEVATPEVLDVLAGSSNWRVRQAVARHEGTPSLLIKKLARDNDSDVRQAVIDRNLPSEWRYLDDNERSTKLSKDSATLEVLDVLSGSSNWRVRQAVASNSKASDKLLKELARDSDSDVASAAREALLLRRLPSEWQSLDTSQKINRINNGKATEYVLEALALSTTQDIRKAVASSLATPVELLRTLSEDEDNEVKKIAKESMIRKLLPKEWMNLDDLEIIERLQQQPASQEVLQALAMSKLLYLRDAVASNVNATIPILLAMKEDSTTPARIQNLLRKTWAAPSQLIA
ncbi:HEAT repeat domain-containing protein [Cyanobium sp. ATX 6E8]|nr:HEAT repeat domain-containing protein [Cyanobium sp. ATX 6E8]